MFRLYVLQKKARDLIELSADDSEKIVAYLVESGGVFENPETRCAQWMKSLGLTSMLQKYIGARERPVPGREGTTQSGTSEHIRFSSCRHRCHPKLSIIPKKESRLQSIPRRNVLYRFLDTALTAAWRNGIASDYESGDCRFDPCGGHYIFQLFFIYHSALLIDRTQALLSLQLRKKKVFLRCRHVDVSAR